MRWLYVEYVGRVVAMLGLLSLAILTVATLPAASVLLLLAAVAVILPWRSL